MAWYTDIKNLTLSTGAGAHWTTAYGPSEKVPVSGIYKCTGCKKEITSNAQDPFPPQNHHQHTAAQGAIRWKLIVRTNTDGE
jgi:hypothetical protein